jgi:hypothetical protein
MDAAAHYRHLCTLGREDFLAAAAPAVLVRSRGPAPDAAATAAATVTFDYALDAELGETVDEAVSHGTVAAAMDPLELYPLVKKPGASFPDRITIGRTPNNDVVIADGSVSRLHAYLRAGGPGWLVADAGSKNGSWLDDAALEPRKETRLAPGAQLRLGDVRLSFWLSADLFDMLGGDHDRR